MSDYPLQTQIANAMADRGIRPLEPRDIRTDGVLCRFTTEADAGHKRNGWAIVFTGDRDVVTFGHWAKHPQAVTVVLKDATRPMSSAEREAARVAIDIARHDRELELESRHRFAQKKLIYVWERAREATRYHPYLHRKALLPHGLREVNGSLYVPLCDFEGTFWSVQEIRCDGRKKFPYGVRVKGLASRIGDERSDEFAICEGWATGAAIHEESGMTVYCALSAGNLKAVALAARQKFPTAKILICADNDSLTEQRTGNNPGVVAANLAAEMVRGKVALPPEGYNDFCDARLASLAVLP